MSLAARRAVAVALLLGLSACGGGEQPANNSIDEIVVADAVPGNRADDAEVVTVAPERSAVDAAATPMNEREAVLGLLNKRNGETREFKLRPGQAARIGDVIVRLRACERTAPWEPEALTGAFVQIDVLQVDRRSWRRVFSGWLYKERPALNVVQHPIYDVWPKSCAMTFRDSGPDTVTAPSAGGGGSLSSAKRSPSTDGEPEASPEVESPSATASNAT